MRWTTLFIAASWLAVNAGLSAAAEVCGSCHAVAVSGAHAPLACGACHVEDGRAMPDPAAARGRAKGCASCHPGRERVFDGPMARRTAEKEFAARTVGAIDPDFFGAECGSCHVRSCLDCHGGKGHAVARPGARSCLGCHSGYFVGADYLGLAPREESLRYARGTPAGGALHLRMLPDVHAEANMTCGDCHSMRSLADGRKSSKGCTDCHRPSSGPVEHRIRAHMATLECYACHAAWGAQEYGSWWIRLDGAGDGTGFRLSRRSPRYARSVYLRKQDAPPLGTDARGKVSPIRPQFIVYYSDARTSASARKENALLAARWKAFFPHTIRRGTIVCGGCHDDARRMMLEEKRDRIYGLLEDGMGLPSFWDRAGQSVANGGFLDCASIARLRSRGPAYKRTFIEKWKGLTDRVDGSSGPQPPPARSRSPRS